jgi:GxxExxY protein
MELSKSRETDGSAGKTRNLFRARVDTENSEGCVRCPQYPRDGISGKVYSNALSLEMRQMGIPCDQEVALKVKHKEVIDRDYFADIVVERRVLIELKVCVSLESVHEAQILNYLMTSGIPVGSLLNFGRPRLEYRRFVL